MKPGRHQALRDRRCYFFVFFFATAFFERTSAFAAAALRAMLGTLPRAERSAGFATTVLWQAENPEPERLDEIFAYFGDTAKTLFTKHKTRTGIGHLNVSAALLPASDRFEGVDAC